METFTDIMKVVEKSLSEKPTEEYITRKTDIKFKTNYRSRTFFTKTTTLHRSLTGSETGRTWHWTSVNLCTNYFYYYQ